MEAASYSSTGFIWGHTLIWVIAISQGSLIAMLPFLYLGIHPYLLTILFIAFIFLGFRIVTGKVIYWVNAEGLQKEVNPFLWRRLGSRYRNQFYTWKQIHSFRSGEDLSRSFETYHYLTIITTDGRKHEINTKKGNKEQFLAFAEAFRFYVNRQNEAMSQEVQKESYPNLKKSERKEDTRPLIREKPSFYKTVFARVLTIFFLLMTLLIIALMITLNNSRPANLFRLFIVIIPGLSYMIYRVFIRKD